MLQWVVPFLQEQRSILQTHAIPTCLYSVDKVRILTTFSKHSYTDQECKHSTKMRSLVWDYIPLALNTSFVMLTQFWFSAELRDVFLPPPYCRLRENANWVFLQSVKDCAFWNRSCWSPSILCLAHFVSYSSLCFLTVIDSFWIFWYFYLKKKNCHCLLNQCSWIWYTLDAISFRKCLIYQAWNT